jgi:hypothetical protein
MPSHLKIEADFYNFSIILDEMKRIEKERIHEVKCAHSVTITEIVSKIRRWTKNYG